MPDQVDNSANLPSPGSTEATPSQTGEGQSSGRKPRNGFESRIAELVKEKHELDRNWQGKYDDLLGDIDQLKAEISQIKGNREKPQSSDSPIFSSFDQMSQADIDKVLASGPSDNPAFYAAVQREDRRRYGEELLNRANQQTAKVNETHVKQQKAWDEIKSRFGPDLDNPQSELRQRAERYMAQLKREYGDSITSDMNAQYRCVAAAHHDLHAQDAEELQAQRREVERLKQVQAMGTGIKSAMKLNDKVEEALGKARKAPNQRESNAAIREGIKNLEMVRDVARD